MPESSLDF